MSGRSNDEVAAVNERIRLLEAENQLLNERSEDIILLGLMAEDLNSLRDVESIFKTVLERVSLLYEIPYAGFGSIRRGSVTILHEFALRSDRIPETTLELTPKAVASLDGGALVCSKSLAEAVGLKIAISGLDPAQIALIPCACRYEHAGVFVFSHDGPDPEFLPRKLLVLQQVIDLATGKIDNILLLDELRRLNLDLEERVHERTADLHRTACALETEIAEREHAEAVVAGERHRLRTVLENLPEGVIVLDARNRVVLANGAVVHAAALIDRFEPGDSVSAIGGRPLAEFRSTTAETSWLEVSPASDPEMVCEVAVRPLGQDQGAVVVIRDVSHQRAVATQLIRQERAAAVGHLAAGIAHDFNNLIQAVTILAESLLLDGDPDPEPRQRKTREILALGERAAALIRQILDYSRQTVTKPQLVDLRRFVTETLAMLNRLIPETVRIRFDASPGGHLVRVDPVQLQQVLTNLALNASQSMTDGGEIQVRLRRSTEPAADHDPIGEGPDTAWVFLSISDTGCGIPPEIQPHIFEPFFTTKERGHGTGLGLAQTYGIIQQNNGRITFESEVDQGTTFTIQLPAQAGELDIDEPLVRVPPPRGHHEVVLVVEDDPTVRDLAGELVKELGYEPLCARDGAEALTIVGGGGPTIQLVLSDVTMPGMGGIELATELQHREPSIPIVLMSGYAPDPMSGGFSSPNLAAWLQKPFTVDDLANTLADVLSVSTSS
jgi:signal transduction histidine kinase